MYPRHSDMCCRMPQVQECGLQVTERQAPRLHTLFAAACEAVGLDSARFPPPPSAGAAGGGGGKGPRLFVLSSPETAVYCTRMPAEEISLPGHQQHDLPRSQQPQPSAADSQAGGLAAGSAHASDLPGAVMTEAAVRRSTLAQLTDIIASSQYCCLSSWCTISDVPHADVMTHLVFKDGLKLQHQFSSCARPAHRTDRTFQLQCPRQKCFGRSLPGLTQSRELLACRTTAAAASSWTGPDGGRRLSAAAARAQVHTPIQLVYSSCVTHWVCPQKPASPKKLMRIREPHATPEEGHALLRGNACNHVSKAHDGKVCMFALVDWNPAVHHHGFLVLEQARRSGVRDFLTAIRRTAPQNQLDRSWGPARADGWRVACCRGCQGRRGRYCGGGHRSRRGPAAAAGAARGARWGAVPRASTATWSASNCVSESFPHFFFVRRKTYARMHSLFHAVV